MASAFAVGKGVEDSNADVVALFTGLRFGQAEAGNLRVAVGSAGHIHVVHRLGFHAHDVLHGGDCLGRGYMGQRHLAGDVADGVDARRAIGSQELVNGDACAVNGNARGIQPQLLHVGLYAYGHQEPSPSRWTA